MNKLLFATFILFLHFCYATELTIEKYGDKGTTYWMVYDTSIQAHKDDLIVFLHGFGAKSPSAYGGWIEDLTSQGFIVIYPMFQTGVFAPRTREFQSRVDNVIDDAYTHIKDKQLAELQSLSFIGHSIGGIIAANLSNEYGISEKHQVNNLILVQPGFKYLKLGKYDNYKNISKQTEIMLITGAKDYAAGNKFTKFVLKKTPQIAVENKIWLEHYSVKLDDKRLHAGHKAPTAPTKSLITDEENFVTKACFKICQTDKVDELVYWFNSSYILNNDIEKENYKAHISMKKKNLYAVVN